MAAGLSWMLLVGAITLGMMVPRQEVLTGFDSDGELDYSAHASAFTPLSLGFVADILGLEELRVAAVDGSDGSTENLDTAAPSDGTSTSVEAAPAPTDVEHPFTNDDVEGAYRVSSLPFRARTDTSEGTRSSDEPGDCFPSGGTAWYRYRPTTDVALFSDTFGTPRATALGVYSRTERGGLELIGCDKNALGNAQVGFPAEAGTAYYFQVTSMAQGGPTIFELAAVGRTTVETLSPSGAPADGAAFDRPAISADGRFIAFTSFARNLASRTPDCGNVFCASVYLRDRLTKRTTLISSTGTSGPHQTNEDTAVGIHLFPSISPDGRYVGFSLPTALPRGAPEGDPTTQEPQRLAYDTYLYDRVTERVTLESRNSKGEPARPDPLEGFDQEGYPPWYVSGSIGVSASANGRYVSFNSDADNMPDRPKYYNVYRRDRVTGKVRLVSTDSNGRPNRGINCAVTGRNISGDGRYVVYWSRNPTGGPTNVYLWDGRTGASRLLSITAGDTGDSYCPSISLDGSRVGFVSVAALVPEDTNKLPDVYVYEIATGRLQRVSVTSAGKQTKDPNFVGREYGYLKRSVTLSADGRFVVFDSAAPDLAPTAVGSTRHSPETTRIFLHDILTGATRLVSVSSTGEPVGGDSHMGYISADGSTVVFMNTSPSASERVMVHELSFFR